MSQRHPAELRVAVTALISVLSAAVSAQTAPLANQIDPNTFIVSHPASPTWKRSHANTSHPAVQVGERAGRESLDANRFIVLPPAHTRWTTAPGTELLARGTP